MVNQTPEQVARDAIDTKLEQAGWLIQNYREANLGQGLGIAVREHPTDSGPADYVLYVNRQPVGVIEAKKDQSILTSHEAQTARYADSRLKWSKKEKPLVFLFEATGQMIRFTDLRDPAARSREVFHFFKPETLAVWYEEPESTRYKLHNNMPPLAQDSLRDCQVTAINGLEKSLAANRPRSLIHMATGAGKTFTAINAVYRLLNHGGAKRILFLVDTKNLGKQAQQEFHAFKPPGKEAFFHENHIVQRLASNTIDSAAEVCICTIQRMYSILSNSPIDESAEDMSPYEIKQTGKQQKFVQYNPKVPIETFDFIIIDECHRSIYNLWKQVLDYFDAFLIGLTATPDKRTYGFFNENIVAEYSYEDSVLDGVNVGYDVYEIETEITQAGAKLKAKEWVDHRDKLTRKKRWAQTEDDTTYSGRELDRSVVNKSQIRKVIQAMKEAVETKIFPSRQEVPKTLIFAKTDSHADDIIQMVREVYGEGNAFCQKVTYNAKNPDEVLSDFRNEYNPRIAVTVDMIATGTDVKPLEILLFMRDVRSKGYYEQMKGRGVRSLSFEELHRISQSASSAKDRFVLIDAVGVEKSCKTESRTLERNPNLSMKDLLQGVAMGHRDDDTIQSLVNRLTRLNKQLNKKELDRLEQITGNSVQALAKQLLNAIDPDAIVELALKNAKAAGFTRGEDSLTEEEKSTAREQLVNAACAPFDNPKLRESIESARREREQLIDHVNLDTVLVSDFGEQAHENAEKLIRTFQQFIVENKEEIAALSFFYQQPYQRRGLTLDMVEELYQQLQKPPLLLTTEKLWSAYSRIKPGQTKGQNQKRQLTDIMALVKFAMGIDGELKPFAEQVDAKFKQWIFRHNAQRKSAFSAEQTEWLRMIKDHIASSCCIERDDFDYNPFIDKGGLQKAWGLFESELDTVMNEMNQELVA
ncbi:type I restriction-modification enzyme R subunit C-terminal domain-containing protein [Hahella aquimaris]|uniref:type I restriction endonuclease subunit R n=1 Tax=Hahella sp. HNIBRBA332 TaxID=3015983 RepID=UPI00273C7A07|nr:type I restriction-modification enzyme R subunit C-terminal domain-containing protein [Hahella sp. HNIBRBA332]WLQ14238.1 type I restriction-modification enzyme R subunit C-terminal domain-containing protein [Hahella sp. HNIBRBA332]